MGQGGGAGWISTVEDEVEVFRVAQELHGERESKTRSCFLLILD